MYVARKALERAVAKRVDERVATGLAWSFWTNDLGLNRAGSKCTGK